MGDAGRWGSVVADCMLWILDLVFAKDVVARVTVNGGCVVACGVRIRIVKLRYLCMSCKRNEVAVSGLYFWPDTLA